MYSQWYCAKYQLIVTSFRSVDRLFIVVFDNVRSRLTKIKMQLVVACFFFSVFCSTTKRIPQIYIFYMKLFVRAHTRYANRMDRNSSKSHKIQLCRRFFSTIWSDYAQEFSFYYHRLGGFSVILWMKFVTSFDS